MQGWTGALILLVTLLVAGCGAGRSTAAPGGTTVEPGVVRVGEAAPRFVLTTTGGQTIDLAELRGRPVVLNFWATWCGPCRIEMPELQAAYDRFAPDGLEIIGVELESSGKPAESQSFLESVGVQFPVYRDDGGVMEDAYISRPAWPTTLFIDAAGTIDYIQVGPMNEQFIAERLSELGF